MTVKRATGPALLAFALGLGLVQPPLASLTPLASSALNAVGLVRADEFRDPERDRWQKPDEVLAALDLKKGDVVADIGAGMGYFTTLFAQAVGPRGKVYAVDIAAQVLEYLKKEARKQNLNNIQIVVSRKDDPLLPAGSVHLAFFSDTIHEIAGRVDFYRKVRRALKPNGRMAVIDWIPATEKRGETRNESWGQVSRDVTVREAEEAGFRLVKEPKFLAEEYFLVFQRVSETPTPR
jgi:predicted methyltransferase